MFTLSELRGSPVRDPIMPSVEFLLDASSMSLQDAELASLSRADSVGKQIRQLLEEWMKHKAAAEQYRWMIDHRDELLSLQPKTVVKADLEEYFAPERKKSA